MTARHKVAPATARAIQVRKRCAESVSLIGVDVSQLVDNLIELVDADEDADQIRRDLLAIAVELLRAGEEMPPNLRHWIAARLSALYEALDSAVSTDVTQALVGLGRRRRGRPVKGSLPSDTWRDAEISAAVAVLETVAGPGHAHRIKESIAEATGRSYDTVDRACDENVIDMGGSEAGEEQRQEQYDLARSLATPVLNALRLSVLRVPQEHDKKIRDLLRSHPRL